MDASIRPEALQHVPGDRIDFIEWSEAVEVGSIQGMTVGLMPPGNQAAPLNLIYHVSNQVQVTVRDISKVSSVLDLAVSNGANSIYGVSFDVSNPTALEDQAREIAEA